MRTLLTQHLPPELETLISNIKNSKTEQTTDFRIALVVQNYCKQHNIQKWDINAIINLGEQ